MLSWERQKTGFYRLMTRNKNWPYEEGIVAEIARGADGKWWVEYLDRKHGWMFDRCRTLHNAKGVAEERCKRSLR
jgi:hypothetical protein